MAQFVQVSDLLLNLDNIVALDSDGTRVNQIWYVGSPTPVALDREVSLKDLRELLQAKGLLLKL